MATKKDDKAQVELDSNSSGDSTDAVNDQAARLAADPALEPELAWERDAAAEKPEQ